MPTATDPEADAISFTIANKPAWASFDPSTGTLEGQPSIADIGSYPNITISATDGLLRGLAERVQDRRGEHGAGLDRAQLGPADGAGRRLAADEPRRLQRLLGHRARPLPESRGDPESGVATHVIDELPPGTYYLVATAYDAHGIESDFSNVATHTIM